MNVAPDSNFANYYHYAYVGFKALLDFDGLILAGQTTPPVVVAMVIVAMWAAIALEIQMMQPYIELVRGNAPAKNSIFLDYTRKRCVDFKHL